MVRKLLKHLIESQQFSKNLIYEIFKKTSDMKQNSKKSLTGKILATLFYEPSTRTRLSFESAMLKLGGNVIGTENAREFSSVVKGESLEDTIRVISNYADAIVIRHNEQGAAKTASKVSNVPIINAGDGKGQHPTQALLDAYTIYDEFSRLNDLKIAMVGDLASGRTVRSLCYLLGKFENNQIFFVSPENLKMKQDIKDYLFKHHVKFSEKNNLDKILPEIDVVYMTRIQKERLDLEDYEKAKGKYVLFEKNLDLIKEKSRVMHPLPHVEEIDLPISVENKDPRIAYFRQARNGLYVRMALLDYILG